MTTETCLEVANLRKERAAADERARLENRKATLQTQITKAITIDELHIDYQAWCLGRDWQPAMIALMNSIGCDKFRQVDGKIRKFGNR